MWPPVSSGRARYLATAAVGTALLVAPTPAVAETATTAVAPTTTCAGAVDDTREFVPIRSIDLPEQASWSGVEVPYDFDVAASVGSFDRVGYCLELDGPTGKQWVWTSMEATTRDARRLGLPTMSGQVTRQQVDDLTVRSNVSSVPAVTDGAGWVEMWPNSYRTWNSEQVPGSSHDVYDTDDQPLFPEKYGSFQVHAFDSAGKPATTAFAVNAFTAPSQPLDVGIGTAADDPATPAVEHPDWTHAANAADYRTRRLTVYVRPGMVEMTDLPQSRQLYARADRSVTSVTVPVSGRVLDQAVAEVELTVRQGSTTTSRTLPVAAGGTFATSVTLPVALVSTDIEVRARGDFGERLVAQALDVVAGDAFVIHGQSNAVATQHGTTSSVGERSPWIRSFGSSEVFHTLSPAYRSWHYAGGDVKDLGGIGQWGLRMARRIVDTYHVPVAVINGAQGGRPIRHFQRDDADPTNQQTNYGRLFSRLQAAGLVNKLAALLWYQGESDRDDAQTHVAGFTTLLADMHADFGSEVPVYVHQVRTSPCRNSDTIALRDAQRRMQDTLGVTLLSTNGLDAHDGCHFSYVGGYRELGDHNFAVIARDLYDGTPQGVAAPNPTEAVTSAAQPRTIVVKLHNPADALTVDPGVAGDFRVNGQAIVSDVSFVKGVGLRLTLTQDVPVDATVAYLGHIGAGPWVTNEIGTGLLAFEVRVVGSSEADAA